MKRILCFFLFFCLGIGCLPACTPQAPTADVHAVQLGDTEKQVIEKAGEPDGKKGLGQDVFGYDTNEFETEGKFIWIRDGKVVMIVSHKGSEFTDREVDDSYVFQSVKKPEEISVWEPGLDIYDIMGFFGPEFTYQEFGYPSSITYALDGGESLRIRFYMNLIQSATYIEKDGKETVLWELGQDGYLP